MDERNTIPPPSNDPIPYERTRPTATGARETTPTPRPGARETTPTPEPRPVDTQASPLSQMHKLIERAGEEPFSNKVTSVLCEPIDDALVDIRPDGLIYVSHLHYRNRLDRAFGVGGWALVPLAVPRVQEGRVLYYGFLKAHGRFVADAVGGQSEERQYSKMAYDDAVEGAKSDCLVRCCKALPLFRECWDKEYADYWKSLYADEVAMPTKRGKGWKKNGTAMRNFDTRPGRLSQGEYSRPPSLDKENQAHIDSIPGNKPLLTVSKHEYEENEEGYNEWEEEK